MCTASIADPTRWSVPGLPSLPPPRTQRSARFTTDPELENGGFLQRCTFFVAPAVTEADFHDDDPSVSWELAQRYDRLVHELGVRYRLNDTEPFVFDDDAREAYLKWWNTFKTHRLERHPNHDITGHCSKLKDKLPRWAALLHAMWCEDERRKPGTITLEDFERVLAACGLRHRQLQDGAGDYLRGSGGGGRGGCAEVERQAPGPSSSRSERFGGPWLSYRKADERTRDAALRGSRRRRRLRAHPECQPARTPVTFRHDILSSDIRSPSIMPMPIMPMMPIAPPRLRLLQCQQD